MNEPFPRVVDVWLDKDSTDVHNAPEKGTCVQFPLHNGMSGRLRAPRAVLPLYEAPIGIGGALYTGLGMNRRSARAD